MDPSLMDDTCVCPDCEDGRALITIHGLGAGGGYYETCKRCEGTSYLICDDLREGERRITVAMQREDIFIVNNGDGTYTAVHPPKE